MHCVYIRTLTVIGMFLFDNFLPLFLGGKQLQFVHHMTSLVWLHGLCPDDHYEPYMEH